MVSPDVSSVFVILAGIRIALYLLLAFIALKWQRRVYAFAMLCLGVLATNTLHLSLHGANLNMITPYDAAIVQTLVAFLLLFDFARARKIRWLLRGKI